MFNRRTFTQVLAAFGVSAALPAWAQAKTVDVTMKQSPKMRFISHTVTFDPSKAANKANVALPAGEAPFDSGPVEEEGTFSHTFTAKGTYKYVCVYHEDMGMVGTVIVS
jgi:plastocyanin